MVSNCINFVAKERILFFFGWVSFHHIYTHVGFIKYIHIYLYLSQFIQSFLNRLTSELILHLNFSELSCYKHRSTDNSLVLISFCLGKFPRVECLTHMVDLFSDIWQLDFFLRYSLGVSKCIFLPYNLTIYIKNQWREDIWEGRRGNHRAYGIISLKK